MILFFFCLFFGFRCLLCTVGTIGYDNTLRDLNMYVSTYLNISDFKISAYCVLTNVLFAVQQLRVLRACSWEGFLSELGWALVLLLRLSMSLRYFVPAALVFSMIAT